MLLFSGVMLQTQLSSISRERELQLENFSGSVELYEKEFSNLFNMAQSIRSLPSFDRFALCRAQDYYNCLTNLFNELSRFSRIVTGENYNLLVHRVNDQTVITNSGTRGLSFVLDELNISQDVYDEVIQRAISENLYPENYILSDDMLLYVSVADYVDTRMIIALYTPISKLDAFSSSSQSPVELIVDDPKFTDLRSERAPGLTAESFGADDILVGIPTLQKAGGTTYALQSSSYVNLYYAAPIRTFTVSDGFVFVLKIAAGFVAIFLLSYGIVRVFSIRLYRPIERLMETFLEFSTENDSARNESEIDFMARQVAQIRGRNQELTRKLEASRSLLQNRFLKQLLLGRLSSSELRELPVQFGLEWVDEPLTVVLFEIADTHSLSPSSVDTAPEDLSHLLEESLNGKAEFRSVQTDLSTVCFLLRTADKVRLHQEITAAVNLIDTAFHLTVCAFIGPPSQSVTEVSRSFFAASRLRDNRNRLPVKSVYDASDLERIPMESTIYSLSVETSLLEATINGDLNNATRIIRSIFDDSVNASFSNVELRDMVIFAWTNTINRALEYTSVPASTLSSEGKFLFLELRSCATAQDLEEYVLKQFTDIISAVRDSSDKKAHDLHDALRAYILENYRRDISLLDLSEHFNLSPTYMSAVFKSTMGDNFKDYLSRLRFDRAAELLRQEPGIKLTQLGEQVGITNVNTLIRIFKKHSGLTPGQYASRHSGV